MQKISPAPSPVRRWSTTEVPPHERLSYWVDSICEAFLEMGCTSHQSAQFDGEITSITHPRMNINRVLASCQDVYRTSREISASLASPFYLICDPLQSWHIEQAQQRIALRPGDAVLLDSSRPFEFHFPQGVSCISLQIPRQVLSQWLMQPDSHELRVTRRDQNWGAAIATISQLLAQDMNHAFQWSPDVLVDHLGALIGAALNPLDSSHLNASKDLYQQALQIMQQRLAQPGLNVDQVAQTLGVSSRTLHRVFAAHQQTFLRCLQNARLTQARCMLEQSTYQRVLTAEIGQRCGFWDPSHFARVFGKRFGMSPSQWRQNHRIALAHSD